MRTEARFAIAVLLMLGVLIGTNWLFPPIVPDAVTSADSTAVEEPTSSLPTDPPPVPADPVIADTNPMSTTGDPVAPTTAAAPPPTRDVVVEGPLFRLRFESRGARLASAELSEFQSLKREGPVDLVPPGITGYLGQKLVVGGDTLDLSAQPFRVEPEDGLTLRSGGGAQTLSFIYEHPTADFSVTQEYTFDPDAYLVTVRGNVHGVSGALLVTDLGEGIEFAEADSAQEARLMAFVHRHAQDGIDATNLEGADPEIVSGPLTWAATKSKFFVLAMLAGEADGEVSEADLLGGLIVAPGEREDFVRIGAAQAVGNDGSFGYRLFLGPLEHARLSAIGQELEEVNPYGWRLFRPIIRPFVSIILTVLVFLHGQLTWSYGWVLVFFGILMRVVFFPFYHKAMKAQLQNMAVQPLMQEIQAKYKDNPERLQKEVMKLHKEHGFNPFAGCLPMLLPWPVLIALFFVFQNTIELRGVPFLWLGDLSAKDPFYILPVVMALSMFLMQWISLRSIEQSNPQMKMMMYIMPPMMLFIFANLPSGLNLYYVTHNIAMLPQQVWIAQERKKMKGKPAPKLSTD